MADASLCPFVLSPLAYIRGCTLLAFTIICFLGVHVSNIGVELDKILQDNSARPKEELGITVGDFNFSSGHDRVFKVGSPPSVATSTTSTASSGSHRTAWMIFITVDRIGTTLPH